ncbi:hypothetical protein BDR03DRAFT_1019395 [Suillus americanus]|nr:hypothetical protein BDR03DRAFT_1019395 [Suillus americanus]
MSDDFDIFALITPAPEDEKTIALRTEVNELLARITEMVKSAPAEDEGHDFLAKEEWCRRWNSSTASLTACLNVAQDAKANISLTDADRQQGQKGRLLCAAFQRQISAMKAAAAMQGDPSSKQKTTGASEHEAGDQDQEADEEHQEKHALECTQERDSEDDNIVEVLPTSHMASKRQKQTPRMSVPRKAHNDPACERCISKKINCYPHPGGLRCAECKRLRNKCSLVGGKFIQQ